MGRNQNDEILNITNLNDGTGIFVDSLATAANGSQTITISNVGNAGIGTATISAWLPVKLSNGTIYYIPMWT